MTGLADRAAALAEAIRASEGRVDPSVWSVAAAVADHVSTRLAFPGDWTVVALVGATGSGKSTLFNAIVGMQVSETRLQPSELASPRLSQSSPGSAQRSSTLDRLGHTRKRPDARLDLVSTAVVWGSDVPEELLAWLDIGRREFIAAPRNDYTDLILVDVPGYDSTEPGHRDEVDRLMERADMLVWVTDPRRCAEAALRETCLVPWAPHNRLRRAPVKPSRLSGAQERSDGGSVMVVALNQIDTLSEAQKSKCLNSLRDVLDSEGLQDTTTVAVSAKTREGVVELGRRILTAVREKQVVAKRLSADVSAAVADLEPELGTDEYRAPDHLVGRRLTGALVSAAGGDTIVEATGKPGRRRRLATDKPLDSADQGQATSLNWPGLTSELAGARLNRVSAEVGAAIDEFVEQSSQGLPPRWAAAVDAAAHSNQALVPAMLEAAIAGTDVQAYRSPTWSMRRVLQWIFTVVAIACLSVLTIDVLLGVHPPNGSWIPASVVLSGVGALAAIVLAVVCWLTIDLGARRARVRMRTAIRKSVASVAASEIVAPVTAELERYRRARNALDRAR